MLTDARPPVKRHYEICDTENSEPHRPPTSPHHVTWTRRPDCRDRISQYQSVCPSALPATHDKLRPTGIFSVNVALYMRPLSTLNYYSQERQLSQTYRASASALVFEVTLLYKHGHSKLFVMALFESPRTSFC